MVPDVSDGDGQYCMLDVAIAKRWQSGSGTTSVSLARFEAEGCLPPDVTDETNRNRRSLEEGFTEVWPHRAAKTSEGGHLVGVFDDGGSSSAGTGASSSEHA